MIIFICVKLQKDYSSSNISPYEESHNGSMVLIIRMDIIIICMTRVVGSIIFQFINGLIFCFIYFPQPELFCSLKTICSIKAIYFLFFIKFRFQEKDPSFSVKHALNLSLLSKERNTFLMIQKISDVLSNLLRR